MTTTTNLRLNTRTHISIISYSYTSSCNATTTTFSSSTNHRKRANHLVVKRVVSCSQSHNNKFEESRRRTISTIALLLFSIPQGAKADGVFNKYIKRKKLDPLDVYVPAVILTQSQFKDLEKTLEGEQPQYAACRSLLRSGPAASLRVNIRAVAQYASDGGDGKAASEDVDQCLRALEDLDALLIHATRNDSKASVETMKSKIEIALGALDSLLKTVPSTILDKGKAIADAYYTPEDVELDKFDPEIQRLESLL
ncbi:hypothetical protein GIB67_035554 [Kingdonia uniflora]|uniref:DUF7880 domain-containing protein n=1 Tax=Kingdonia uniflora TaxID=39325 RepID=A0A7J7LD25_9MAGN|nr:hypothetical protein GIB67_035554 [Kingdonia uniflora]